MTPSSDHIERNREAWNGWAADYEAAGRLAWAADEPWWPLGGPGEPAARAAR